MSAPTPLTTDAGIDDAGVPDAPPEMSVVTPDVEAPPAGPPKQAAGAAPPLVAPALPQASRIRRGAAALGWAVVGVAIFVALWALAASRNPKLPTPGDTFTNLREMLADPFYDNGPDDKGVGLLVWATLLRVFKGWALATLVGVPLAWFPILAFALGESEIAAVWTVFVIALWPTVLNTAAGAAAVPVDQRDVARVFRFGRFTYLRHVLFPNVLPYMVTGLRLSMGIGWIVIVAIEMLGGTSGIGRQIWTWYNALDLPKVAAGIVIVGVVGLVLDTVLMRLAKAVAIDEGSPS